MFNSNTDVDAIHQALDALVRSRGQTRAFIDLASDLSASGASVARKFLIENGLGVLVHLTRASWNRVPS